MSGEDSSVEDIAAGIVVHFAGRLVAVVGCIGHVYIEIALRADLGLALEKHTVVAAADIAAVAVGVAQAKVWKQA